MNEKSMETATFIVWLVSVLSFSTGASPVLAKLDETTLQTAKIIHQSAKEAGIDPKGFIRIAECESKLSRNAKGDFRNGEYKARGVFQWWEKSFDSYARHYGVTDLHYLDYRDQSLLAAMVIRDGGLNNWKNCADIMWYRND